MPRPLPAGPWTGKENYYQTIDHPCDRPFVVLHRHPAVGMISGSIDYIPALLPVRKDGIWVAFFPRCQRYRCGQVWGNPRTISWEPHLERTLAQGQEASWTVEYEFGAAGKPSL